MRIPFYAALFALGSATVFADPAEDFYSGPALFSKRPTGKQTVEVIERFGPVGMRLHLIKPVFTLEIAEIEEGSPADRTGKFEKGQIIESINGKALADIDPRIQLGNMITAAEASDGILEFAIKDEAEPVVVKIPVLGKYSETWPLDCPKSEKIIDNFAHYISQPGAIGGRSRAFGMGMLFLLSTGEDKYLPVVKEWAVNGIGDSRYAWKIGYAGLALCEYYLRTGDQEVLAKIQRWVDIAESTQVNDSWAGRGGVTRNIFYGSGHLNAAATGVLTFLLLAKECGADVPEHTLQSALRHFYRYSGRGGNPYGDGVPEAGYAGNGKNGLLAFAMAAAAALDPEGEDSIYAAARDYSAMESFYSTTYMLHGHTGGGIGEIWRSAAMGLLHDKFPKQYRDFMDSRRWHYELSRRWDGSFAILGGGGYDNVNWGAGYTLAYTMPRKALRLNGAPPTQYSNLYDLPERPWGNAADEEFVTIEPVPFPDGTVQDLSGETLEKHGALQLYRRLHGKTPASDEELWKILHHRNYVYRHIAATTLLGAYFNYYGKPVGSGEARTGLFHRALASDQVRVRRSILHGLDQVLNKGPKELKEQLLTKEVFDTIVTFVENPDESWYVKHGALNVMSYAPEAWLVPHMDLLLSFLDHEEHWVQRGALDALTPIIGQPSTYRKIIPAVAEVIRTNQRPALTVGMQPGMRKRIIAAAPEVHELAAKELGKSYAGFESTTPEPGGQDITVLINNHMDFIAESLADIPGGYDLLYQIARQRKPNEILPHKELFLEADPAQLSDELKEKIKPIIRDELIPAFVGRNREDLDKWLEQTTQTSAPGTRDEINELAMLHNRAGDDDYDWEMFANLIQAEWSYFSFDPIAEEQVPFDRLKVRYREVTLPENTKNWQQPSFDPAAAGWKVGQSPFANYLGKLPTQPFSKCGPECVGPGCYGAIQPNTLWEKEVLLMRGTFDIPALKPQHRYRIRVNMGEHVGNGNGYGIWINGKQLTEVTRVINRGGGGMPQGAFITAPFRQEFQGQPVTIAIKSFLRDGDKRKGFPKTKKPQGRMSMQIEEQKIPPVNDELVRQSATAVGMRGDAWLEAYTEEGADIEPDDFLFRWDGQFVANDKITGSWKLLGVTTDPEGVDPTKDLSSGRRPDFKTITFKDGGDTDFVRRLWSGDMLINLDQYYAQRMWTKKIGGKAYLLIQSPGNFYRPKQGQKPEIEWQVFGR
mgnify:CR=1 FL=1